MKIFPKLWSNKTKDHNLFIKIKGLLGYMPKNKNVYIAAFTHRSMNIKNLDGKPQNFERLEYLGDSVLSTIVASFLFEVLPNADEGKLTRMKSKIVSREKLNFIGKQMGLLDLLVFSGKKDNLGDDVYGNLLEALIGAIFIDKGYETCKSILKEIFFKPYIEIETLDKEVISYKSLLIEWSQKQKQNLVFETEADNGKDPSVNFYCKILVNNKVVTKSRDLSKKKAEEKAAKKAHRILKI
ncbi:ribonuclease III [Flavobacteriaceae bacterium]|nr:ribonuclease III [Flavobacteriaceae bacterium]MDB4642988.1 ribonuclease III [Flavobacteriaceae bacterium]